MHDAVDLEAPPRLCGTGFERELAMVLAGLSSAVDPGLALAGNDDATMGQPQGG
jgi:hypothetical protein